MKPACYYQAYESLAATQLNEAANILLHLADQAEKDGKDNSGYLEMLLVLSEADILVRELLNSVKVC